MNREQADAVRSDVHRRIQGVLSPRHLGLVMHHVGQALALAAAKAEEVCRPQGGVAQALNDIEFAFAQYVVRRDEAAHANMKAKLNMARALLGHKPAGPWTSHWSGSSPYKGWSIRQGRDEVIWFGETISSETVEGIVLAHNKCFDCGGTGCVMNCSGLRPTTPVQSAENCPTCGLGVDPKCGCVRGRERAAQEEAKK